MIPLHDDNPTELTPFLTIGLIGACVLVFLWQMQLGPELGQRAMLGLGVIPAVLLHKAQLPPELSLVSPELTLLSSMFLHGGWLHLAGNILYLWIFGNNVEDAMGHVRFIVFYVLCGIAAAGLQIFMNQDSTIPMIGASGAISGILGAYLLLYPHARVLVVVPIGFMSQLIRLPASWVLGFYFLIQIISSLSAAPGQPGVAWYAHIGGFVAGAALIPLFKYASVPLFHPAHGSRDFLDRNR
ncbi:MAG: rhomboid family intramembrane serine protease [Gammaproteobacteria bacterium]|nr:rhomboid family intramembrane serine protease [Gammaproteobacteria bacterium]NNM00903.1 rhomboid family intramembrane serine protease [Gammaproteobacteria bacterium]